MKCFGVSLLIDGLVLAIYAACRPVERVPVELFGQLATVAAIACFGLGLSLLVERRSQAESSGRRSTSRTSGQCL